MTNLATTKPRWMTSNSEPEVPTPGEWSIIACIRPRFHDTLVTVTTPNGEGLVQLTDPADDRDGALAAAERARAIAQVLVEVAPIAWAQADYWALLEHGGGVVGPSAQDAYDAALKEGWGRAKTLFEAEKTPGQHWKAPYARFAEWFEFASRSPRAYPVVSL